MSNSSLQKSKNQANYRKYNKKEPVLHGIVHNAWLYVIVYTLIDYDKMSNSPLQKSKNQANCGKYNKKEPVLHGILYNVWLRSLYCL